MKKYIVRIIKTGIVINALMLVGIVTVGAGEILALEGAAWAGGYFAEEVFGAAIFDGAVVAVEETIGITEVAIALGLGATAPVIVPIASSVAASALVPIALMYVPFAAPVVAVLEYFDVIDWF